ncbi:MAG: hypothetical protein QGG74_05635 [Phycisphaerales bacterium]|nr:hypothetical protein [Phycisphaerales bacterium]
MLLALPLGRSLAFGGDVPANDDCEGAASLVVGTMEIDTAPATTGPPWSDFQNCENFGVFQMHRDLWYRWTAPSSDILRLDLCDAANFDSRIAVYEGTCGGLELVACNDDGLYCHDNTSQLDLAVTAGTPYYVRIGGLSESSASLATLSVTFPWHDCLEPLLPCESEFDRNGSVDVDDILTVLGHWNADGPPRPSGDCDPLSFGDCRTDVNDLLSALSSLGACSLACEMPWSCGQSPTDFQCSAIDDDCICMEAIVGGTPCTNIVTDPACQDMQYAKAATARRDTCPPPCPAGEIEDCNGNYAPIDWIGDNHYDDGSYSWNGIPIHFDCDLFDCDGGVCTCIP